MWTDFLLLWGEKILNKRIKTLLLTIAFSFTIFQFKVNAATSLNTPRINIDSNKEWTVKFNNTLNASTVNSSNITVVDEDNNNIPVSVTLGKDETTVFVSPKVSGYDPGENYYLIVGKGVKSALNQELTSPVKLKFTIGNKYSDGTSYSDLPNIVSNKFKYQPLLSSQKQGFILSSTGGQDVQYRIFVTADNPADKEDFQDMTGGYISSKNGEITCNKTLSAGTEGQKYKAIIYIKRAGTEGAHRDINTDYDNYFVDYFRCVDKLDVQDSSYYKDYDISLLDIADTQLKTAPVFVETNAFNNSASSNQIKYYLDPDNFLDGYGKYQFLKLNYSDGITADSLNTFLQDKGIFKDCGQTFIDAAKDNNISVSYLVSHAMLETGNGTSILANGGTKDSNGNYIYGKPVYNFFGIGAVDSDPNGAGTKKAYDEGWFTIKDGIEGGASWIASKYINNPTYKQDTVYKMRWNPDKPGEHEYATDISWAYKQISNIMNGIESLSSSGETLNFEIPRYK